MRSDRRMSKAATWSAVVALVGLSGALIGGPSVEAKVAAGGRVCFPVSGDPGDAAVVNLTPVRAERGGNGLLVSSDVSNPPEASNVNYLPGPADPNVAVAPIGADGEVCFVNAEFGPVDLVADHLGTIDGDVFTPASSSGAPVRRVDTRDDDVEPGGSGPWSVVRIIDGDTLDVSGPGGVWTVRLVGINTPESGECLAEEAADALAMLTTGDLRLIRDVSDVDGYGRKLRYVETSDGTDVGAELVRRGYAISRRFEPDTARNATYDALQDAARAAARGRWAPDACGPASEDVSIDLEIHYDAAGNDNDNLNDEWVRFTNTGTAPLDLDGWEVADESASHRYRFGPLTLAPGASVTLYTGCGADTGTARYWCNDGSAVWNNSGDTVFLSDPSGNVVLAESYDGG